MMRAEKPLNKVAIVAANGLGDGLIAHLLSYNLHKAGHSVTTFSSPLTHLKRWFPGYAIAPFPTTEQFEATFTPFDTVISIGDSILKKIILKNGLYLPRESFDRKATMVQNMVRACKERLFLPHVEIKNGLTPPPELQWKKEGRRVILHPMATCPKRMWPHHKFMELAHALIAEGFFPLFVMSSQERASWPNDPALVAPTTSLDEMASLLYESGFLIGNDSGIGHLASNMGLPTFSLFARKSYSNLWRPGFHENGVVITPYPLLLGARMKQKYWKGLTPVRKVMKAFLLNAETQSL